MSPITAGVIGIGLLLILFMIRMPVAYAMGIIGLAGSIYLVTIQGSLHLLATDIFSNFNSYSMSVLPLFILMGYIAFYSGIGKRLFDTADKFIGHIHGGLAMATIIACACFGAICGSAGATVATMSAICVPEMKRHNYDSALATGTVAAGNVLGPLIPPSTVFIIYGAITGESIGKLFIAGILPGILVTIIYCLTIYLQTKLNPRLGPPRVQKVSLREALSSIPGGTGESLIIFGFVMGGLMYGLFTPSEAGAIGAFGMLLVVLAGRRLDRKGLFKALADSTRVTTFILLIIATGLVFSHFIVITTIPQSINNYITTLNLSPYLVLIGIFIVYGILGCFIEAYAMIITTIPIFIPMIKQIGFDPIWFGVVIVIVGGLGAITPPVGLAVYIVSGATGTPLSTAFKGAWPFVVSIYVCLIILMYFPQIATFLPGLMK